MMNTNYSMAWVVPAIPKKLLFGPAPKSLEDLRYLVEKRNVHTIINLCPVNRLHYTPKIDHETEDKIPFVSKHVPLADKFEELHENKQVAEYVRIIKQIRLESDKCYYIHKDDGASDEAYVALGIAALILKKRPRLQELQQKHPRICRMGEQKIMFDKVLNRVMQFAGGIASMLEPVKKKIKTEK